MSARKLLPASFLLRAGRVRKWREGRGKPFYPPLESGLVVGLAWRLLPRLLWRTARIRKIEIEGIDRLEALKGDRVVLTPNHPTRTDPLVMFELSRRLGEPFAYIASRESFAMPFFGKILQWCGVYSVKRGVVDRASMKTTRQIIADGKRKLVVFPEGLVYGQNDRLMPFHEGVFKFGEWALNDLKKNELEATIYYVPVALRYQYTQPMDGEIDAALQRLEEYLELPEATLDRYDRLLRVGSKVVEGYESAYGVKPTEDASLNDRIQFMKNLWIERAASALGIKDNPENTMGDRIRAIINALDSITISQGSASGFERETIARRQRETESIYKDLERASRFLATEAGYVAENPTDERYLEVIAQIEEELFGISDVRGPKVAKAVIGEPVSLNDSARVLSKEVENQVYTLLRG